MFGSFGNALLSWLSYNQFYKLQKVKPDATKEIFNKKEKKAMQSLLWGHHIGYQ